jgi:hypothetical protein
MAHRSKKKHLKHAHQHEPATPKAKSPIAKAEAAAAGIAKKTRGTVRRAPEMLDAGKRKSKGLVRRIAAKATKVAAKARRAVVARPKKMIARAKARVSSMISADER